MKIQKITLKEVAVREVNGEYEKVYINEKTYPLFLTNASLKKGKQQGIIAGSLIGELSKLQALESLKDDDLSDLSNVDDTQMIQVVYLAFIGANKKEEYTFDEFLELYHLDFTETLQLYVQLISETMGSEENKFATGFKDVTEKSKKK